VRAPEGVRFFDGKRTPAERKESWEGKEPSQGVREYCPMTTTEESACACRASSSAARRDGNGRDGEMPPILVWSGVHVVKSAVPIFLVILANHCS